ncbi:hypothetical protein [Flavobacterium limnosediminis]|nr:hypothetical protein [Flavobacterium limnosediminis]
MNLNWAEKYLIILLRETYHFFSIHGYHISNIEYDGYSRDGLFVMYENYLKKNKIFIKYTPGFDFLVIKEGGLMRKQTTISVSEILELSTLNQINDGTQNEFEVFKQQVSLCVKYLKENSKLI